MSEEKNINLIPEKPENKIRKGWSDLWAGSVEFFKKLIDLRNGLDREGTIVNIKNNKRMQGANAWLLMCPSMLGKPVRKFDTARIPTACCERPVSNDARVGEHSGVTWKFVN